MISISQNPHNQGYYVTQVYHKETLCLMCVCCLNLSYASVWLQLCISEGRYAWSRTTKGDEHMKTSARQTRNRYKDRRGNKLKHVQASQVQNKKEVHS